jgi:hypothetical protein
MSLSTEQRNYAIKETVKTYLLVVSQAAYAGEVTTKDVVDVVHQTFNHELDTRFTARDRGEVYDAIRFYGPVGEEDTVWLMLWGPDRPNGEAVGAA